MPSLIYLLWEVDEIAMYILRQRRDQLFRIHPIASLLFNIQTHYSSYGINTYKGDKVERKKIWRFILGGGGRGRRFIQLDMLIT